MSYCECLERVHMCYCECLERVHMSYCECLERVHMFSLSLSLSVFSILFRCSVLLALFTKLILLRQRVVWRCP